MRDPNRIDAFCAALAEQWKRYPDFRFSQFILNTIGAEGDPWNFEEPKMMEVITRAMDIMLGEKK